MVGGGRRRGLPPKRTYRYVLGHKVPGWGEIFAGRQILKCQKGLTSFVDELFEVESRGDQVVVVKSGRDQVVLVESGGDLVDVV